MKTICIYHSRDLDGWMSAAIVKKWWLKDNGDRYHSHGFNIMKKDGTIVDNLAMYKSDNTLAFLGWDYGDGIPDLSDYDEVIMCDVSFPAKEMYYLCITKDFIFNDHHASALASYEELRESLPQEYYVKGLRSIEYAACELTWRYFFPNEEMPEIVRLLGLYDSFRHKNTGEEAKVLEFQYGARESLKNYMDCYSVISMPKEHQDTFEWSTLEKGKAIYQYLCTEAKQFGGGGHRGAAGFIVNDLKDVGI